MNLPGLIPSDSPIAFPGLFGAWRFTAGPTLGDIFTNAPAFIARIHWYGVFIALGMLLAVAFCARQAPRLGLTEDNVLDTAIACVPAGIIGARLYYIVFNFSLYRGAGGAPDVGKMLRIWDGGLAIYGGILAGYLAVCAVSRLRGFSRRAILDVAAMGAMIGQILGRWGNFMNREAFGALTQVPWRMRLWAYDGAAYDVHPTFLYESLWNLAGFLLIWRMVLPRRRFDGQIMFSYFFWYGLGRLWIEGLREDSLYLFGVTAFGAPVRVSQALSALLLAASAVLLLRGMRRHGGQN